MHGILQSGLIDSISYEPPDTDRMFGLMQKLELNKQKNLGNQDQFDLLMAFQTEQNGLILDEVLRCNFDAEILKNEFSEAVFEPRKL